MKPSGHMRGKVRPFTLVASVALMMCGDRCTDHSDQSYAPLAQAHAGAEDSRTARTADRDAARRAVEMAALLIPELTERARKPDPSASANPLDWDEAVNLALTVRARVELLQSGVVGAADAAILRERAARAARAVASYEATGELGRRYCKAICFDARGWGTSKSIELGPIRTEVALDAYSTGIALGALAELAEYFLEQGDRGRAAEFYWLAEPVAEHWLAARRFEAPGGGPAWEKVVTRVPAVRNYVAFNTDALIARSLLLLSPVAAALGDSGAAVRYETNALGVARNLRRWVLEEVVAAGQPARPARWRYGLEVRADGTAAAQRIEDSNHASLTLDFIALAVERQLGVSTGAPVFSRHDLSALAEVLHEAVFVEGPSGEPQYTVYVDPATVLRKGARGKQVQAAFSLQPSAESSLRVASWWKELGGSQRSLDMGLSIRTSWGWSRSMRGNAVGLERIGRYLRAAAADPSHANARNLFLARAVWLRMVRGLGV